MMCFKCRKLLMPYAEGGLDDRTRLRIQRHLAGCARCREELECITAVSGALRNTDNPAVEPAPDLWEKVSARIAHQIPSAQPSKPRFSVPYAVSAGAAAVLVAVVGFSLIQPDLPTPAPQPVAPRERVVVAPESMPEKPDDGRKEEIAAPAPETAEPVDAVRPYNAEDAKPGRELTASGSSKPAGKKPVRSAIRYSRAGTEDHKSDLVSVKPAKDSFSISPDGLARGSGVSDTSLGGSVVEEADASAASAPAAPSGESKHASAAAGYVYNGSFEIPTAEGTAGRTRLKSENAKLADSASSEDYTDSAGVYYSAHLPELTAAELNNYTRGVSGSDSRYGASSDGNLGSIRTNGLWCDLADEDADRNPSSVVDELSETEGERIAALFTYP